MTISIKPTASGSTIEQDGSTILTVDGSGNIDVANNLTSTGNLYPKVPAFRAYLNSNQTISSATFTKIAFDTEEYDTTNAYDNTTNYSFQPTVAGYYAISVNTVIANVTNNRAILDIFKNASGEQRLYDITASGTRANSGITVMYLNGTTDYISANIYFSTGTDLIGNASGSSRTSIQAHLVSV